jgi:hypothetical protein
MNETELANTPKHPPLGVSDRVSIINALMEQDRIEIRERQEAVFRLTYLVVPGFIAIAAFSIEHSELRIIFVLGLILILAIYLVSFFTFLSWLKETRACQQIREAFYLHQNLFYADPFRPIRQIEEMDRKLRLKDNALWFPFGVAVVSAAVLLTYMLMS